MFFFIYRSTQVIITIMIKVLFYIIFADMIKTNANYRYKMDDGN